jgi:hypothetical protein
MVDVARNGKDMHTRVRATKETAETELRMSIRADKHDPA